MPRPSRRWDNSWILPSGLSISTKKTETLRPRRMPFISWERELLTTGRPSWVLNKVRGSLTYFDKRLKGIQNSCLFGKITHGLNRQAPSQERRYDWWWCLASPLYFAYIILFLLNQRWTSAHTLTFANGIAFQSRKLSALSLCLCVSVSLCHKCVLEEELE